MRKFGVMALGVLVLIGLSVSAGFAQPQNKKQKGKNATIPMPPLPISQEIDHNIGEMLGAWQVGDVEAMHKYYADDATWVSGTFSPPVKGWPAYAADYERMRKTVSAVQLIRRNTDIFHYGDVAWASYQWQFIGTVEGRQENAYGQTTLVFVKTGDKWLIVHNHTSEICSQAPSQVTTPGPSGN